MSKRYFKIAVCDHIGLTIEAVSYESLTSKRDDSYEWIYALQETLDSVLDLQVGESMYFQPNRDQKETKGIILRIG